MFKRSRIVAPLGVAILALLAVPAEAGSPQDLPEAPTSLDVATGLGDEVARGRHGFYGGPCTRHARLMRQACLADGVDDYLVHRADCVYVTAREDERSCRTDAREEARAHVEECAEVYEARLDLCDLVGEQRFDEEFDPDEFVDPNDVGAAVDPNPYWPLTAGHTHVIVAVTEDDDGEEVTEVVVVTATDEVIEVGGLPCRVIRDIAFEEVVEDSRGAGDPEVEYEAIEVTQDWYGQQVNGDIVYCGENTYEIEDGLIDNTDGSFAEGTDRARAGFLVRAAPIVGEGDRQEMASDEAEDYVRYEALMTSPEGADVASYPCDGGCLQTFEVNPQDPGQAEYKFYKPGLGFVLAVKLDEDGEPTGEREEVTCIGDSIDVLTEQSELCGVRDPEALLDALCAWAPEALCFD